MISTVILSMLLSCAKSDDAQADKPADPTTAAVDGTTEETPDETEETIKANLPEANYDGYEFTILKKRRIYGLPAS